MSSSYFQATEIGRAQIDFAFGKLGVSELFALAHPENTLSIKVLKEKLGMDFLEVIDTHDRGPRKVFSITRTKFAKQEQQLNEIVDLDTSNSVLMRQWQDLHLEWLRKHDLWEPADQVLSIVRVYTTQSLPRTNACIQPLGGRMHWIDLRST